MAFLTLYCKVVANSKKEGSLVDRSILTGIEIGAAVVLGVAAVANSNVFEHGPQYAQAASTTSVRESTETPRQECRSTTVAHRKPVQDENRITGSVSDAAAGGVIGYQFSDKRGKDIATVVGALGGGCTGSQIQSSMQENDIYTTT